jgi:hypothetical protein
VRAQDLISELITSRDRAALEYLQDVRWTKGVMGYFLEFYFADNPFFYNKVGRLLCVGQTLLPVTPFRDVDARALGIEHRGFHP